MISVSVHIYFSRCFHKVVFCRFFLTAVCSFGLQIKCFPQASSSCFMKLHLTTHERAAGEHTGRRTITNTLWRRCSPTVHLNKNLSPPYVTCQLRRKLERIAFKVDDSFSKCSSDWCQRVQANAKPTLKSVIFKFTTFTKYYDIVYWH